MTYLMILSTVFGVLGIAANIAIFWQKDRKRLLTVKLFADIAWTTHYALLRAWTGAATCGISIIRETVFLNRKNKWAKSVLWLVLFILLSVISGIVTWKNIVNILPVCAAILSVISFAIAKPHLTRAFQIFISVSFLIYDIYCLSYAGMVNEVCTLTSVVFALLYYGRKRRKITELSDGDESR